jgi:hypothetical protein
MIAGGPVRPQSYFDAVAPYHWDYQTNGSEAMRQTATYYCSYLAGRPVQFAGPDVKPPTGPAPKRKVGVIFPGDQRGPHLQDRRDEFAKQVSGGVCGSKAGRVFQYPYQSDITTAQAQSTSLVSSMKNDGITTLVWFSDPLAPIFITSAMAQQNFRPENLTTGIQLMDLGRAGPAVRPERLALRVRRERGPELRQAGRRGGGRRLEGRRRQRPAERQLPRHLAVHGADGQLLPPRRAQADAFHHP